MTIADLLRHTSGLVSQADAVLGEAYTRHGLLTSASTRHVQAEMIDAVGTLPLKCDPGAQVQAVGISTDVVSYLCEVLSGQRLDAFLRERLLDPLGMVDTGFVVAAEDIERFAACYRPGQPASRAWWSRTDRTSPAAIRSRGPTCPARAVWSPLPPTICAFVRCSSTAESWMAGASLARGP